MGKQINFYMNETVQHQFLEYLKQKGFLFLDNQSNKIDKPDAKDIFGMYLHKAEYGEVIKKPEGFLKDYQMLVRWIKKHVPYQEMKAGDAVIKEYVNDELKQVQEEGFWLIL